MEFFIVKDSCVFFIRGWICNNFMFYYWGNSFWYKRFLDFCCLIFGKYLEVFWKILDYDEYLKFFRYFRKGRI